jgi:hypothetical protein
VSIVLRPASPGHKDADGRPSSPAAEQWRIEALSSDPQFAPARLVMGMR